MSRHEDACRNLKPDLAQTVRTDSIKPFAEGAWFAKRETGWAFSYYGAVEHALWWTDDGRRVLSLAVGTGLHGYDVHHNGGVDWEVNAFEGGAHGKENDECCHGTQLEAERCALTFLTTGYYCSDGGVDPQ